jgi:hypothetical protein
MAEVRPVPARAPSVTVSLRYLGGAVAAFVAAALAIPWLAGALAGHYYQPRLLALTHAVTLGWITLAIMGASYQLIPIVLERPLWSERLARWQFVIAASGVLGMVAHFLLADASGLLWAAGIVAVAATLHIVNVALTLRGFRRWTFTARLVVLGFAGLGLTVLFGLALAADRVRPFLPTPFYPTLHAHFHLALLGWVAPMIVGVAARAYPMFLLAPEPAGRLGLLQLCGLAAGAPMVAVGLLGAPALVPIGGLAVAAALGAHGWWVLGMARDRRRPALDWGLRLTLAGAAFLAPATALGLAQALGLVAGPRVALAWAVLALGGWVSLTIAGMMLKIVPFLVWYRVYGPRVGRAPVPTLGALGWPPGEAAAFWLLASGVVGLAAAVAAGAAPAIRVAGAVLALGALAFALALVRVLRHLAPGVARRLEARTAGATLR